MYFFYGIKNSKENPEIKAQLEKKQQKEKSKLLNQYNEYRQRHTSSGSSSGRTSPSKNPTNTSLLRSSLSYQSPTDFSSVDQTCLKLGQDFQDKRSPSFRRREEMDSHREVTGARMNSFYNKNQKKRSVSRKVRGSFCTNEFLLIDQNFAPCFHRNPDLSLSIKTSSDKLPWDRETTLTNQQIPQISSKTSNHSFAPRFSLDDSNDTSQNIDKKKEKSLYNQSYASRAGTGGWTSYDPGMIVSGNEAGPAYGVNMHRANKSLIKKRDRDYSQVKIV